MLEETLGQFRFRVNKSFLGRGHAITIPQHLKAEVLANVGPIYRSQCSVEVVNTAGRSMDGTIRHSINNGGEYLQLNTLDPEVTAGLDFGQYITVEMLRSEAGFSCRLKAC